MKDRALSQSRIFRSALAGAASTIDTLCHMWHNMFPMDESAQSKSVIWMGSSLRDLKKFPAEVKGVMGYALYQAQIGGKAAAAKPLTGFGGATVLEIVEDFRSDTYRAVYTVKFSEAVYVLHAFQKKSKKVSRHQSLILTSLRDD
jgi:phage-related protein